MGELVFGGYWFKELVVKRLLCCQQPCKDSFEDWVFSADGKDDNAYFHCISELLDHKAVLQHFDSEVKSPPHVVGANVLAGGGLYSIFRLFFVFCFWDG